MAHSIKKAKSLLVRKENVEKVKALIAQKEKLEKIKALLVRKDDAEKAEAPVVRRKTVSMPHKSKLMICVEVLCALSSGGPMKLAQLRDWLEMDECRLEPHLRLLWDRGLVEEENFGEENNRYVVTKRGLNVLKVVSPIIKEAHKIQIRELESISNKLSVAGYT
jgi:predicted transcriptional regulator